MAGVWHPSSLGVSGATDHSLEPGEEVTQEFLVVGRRGRAVWTVRERVYPRRWVIDGRVEGDGLLDRLVLRRRVEADSAEALRRLKEVLERRAT